MHAKYNNNSIMGYIRDFKRDIKLVDVKSHSGRSHWLELERATGGRAESLQVDGRSFPVKTRPDRMPSGGERDLIKADEDRPTDLLSSERQTSVVDRK